MKSKLDLNIVSRVFRKEIFNEKGKAIGYEHLRTEFVWEACRAAIRGGRRVSLPGRNFRATTIFKEQVPKCDEVKERLAELEAADKLLLVAVDEQRGVLIKKMAG